MISQTASSHTTNLTGGGYSGNPTTSTNNSYVWWEGAQQSQTLFKPNINQSTTFTSDYSYNANGRITSVNIADGRPRYVSFFNNADGQVLERAESSSASTNPLDYYYYFAGTKIGDNSNNGTSETDYATAIANRSITSGTGAFRYGATTGTAYADFDQSYQAINPGSTGGAASSYTVGEGDTLQSIAQAVWGDAALWYLLADANGLNGTESLIGGMTLSIPNKVSNVHNTSETFRPYDPNKALGDLSPTTPKPPPKAHSGCGSIGQIIMVVIAVVVAHFVLGPLAHILTPYFTAALATVGVTGTVGTIVAGTAALAVAGAVTSVVTQGVNMAVGLQSKFDWKQVGIGAISAMVYGVGGAGDAAGKLTVASVAAAAGRAVLGNVLTQGIAVATGLQSKFDWAGVAAAGVLGGVTKVVGSWSVLQSAPSVVSQAVVGVAGAIAGAGARSLINGSDFGDNILAALPDVIGATIGNAIVGGIAKAQFDKKVDSQKAKIDADPRFSEWSEPEKVQAATSLTVDDLSLKLPQGFVLNNLDDDGIGALRKFSALKVSGGSVSDPVSSTEVRTTTVDYLQGVKRATATAPEGSRLTDSQIGAIMAPFDKVGLTTVGGDTDTNLYIAGSINGVNYTNDVIANGFHQFKRYFGEDYAIKPEAVLGAEWADAALVGAGHALHDVGQTLADHPWMGIALDVFSAVTSPVAFVATKIVGAIAGDAINKQVSRVATAIATPFLKNGYSAESAQYAALGAIGIAGIGIMLASIPLAIRFISLAESIAPNIVKGIRGALDSVPRLRLGGTTGAAGSGVLRLAGETLDANAVRFSQRSVSWEKLRPGGSYTYQDIVDSMSTKGWQGDPIDVVRMPDGGMTSMDNTRLLAAREAGINVQATIHDFDEPLSAGRASSLAKPKINFYPKTWGEAITGRINGQGSAFRMNNPFGTYNRPNIKGKPNG